MRVSAILAFLRACVRDFSFFFSARGTIENHLSPLCYISSLTLSACLLIDLPDPNLGMGASGTQASGGAVVPKGTNKRRAA